jgi:hypothetical protein
MSPEVKWHQDRQGASDKTSGECLKPGGAPLGHVWGMK